MNFFEHQALARRNTRVLVVMFVIAVVAVVAVVDLFVAFLVSPYPAGVGGARFFGVPWQIHAIVSGGVLLIIAMTSLHRLFQLRDGGQAIAEMIGGRAVSRGTRDPLEQRLLNVVDEMSIASGVHLPKVYVMDGEKGVNAFAAGFNVSDTVVAVTRGALETLNRDELQAVVGHEFSHILHGDMGLNVRMMGVLAGIVSIGAIGAFMMRGSPHADDLRAVIALFLFGLVIFTIGSVGLLFARMIKAAVSRQREFLADASAVQFTRNPDGLAGALDQIGASRRGTLVQDRFAEEMSHMFFGPGVRGTLLDTHPPLDERIRRVHPAFRAQNYRNARPKIEVVPDTPIEPEAAAAIVAAALAATVPGIAPPAGRRANDHGELWNRTPAESAALVGSIDAAGLAYASRLLKAIPAELQAKLRDAEASRAIVIAMLLAPVDVVMEPQLAALKDAGLAWLGARAKALEPKTRVLGPEFRFAVFDLALSAMQGLGVDARQELIKGVETVIHADRRVTLHEFIALTLVREQLSPDRKTRPDAGKRRVADLAPECGALLSLVAHAGTRPDASGARLDALKQSLAAGAREMGIEEPPAEARQIDLERATQALAALKSLAPMEKPRLVKGLFAAVTADGTIRILEAELLRLTGAVLDCPLPPLLTEMDPTALAA